MHILTSDAKKYVSDSGYERKESFGAYLNFCIEVDFGCPKIDLVK